MSYRQWIHLASGSLIICGIPLCIFSCCVKYECQFPDYLKRGFFALASFLVGVVFTYYLQKFLQCCKLKKYEQPEQRHKLESLHFSQKQKISFAFDHLPEELSDALQWFHKRRHSYPLQVSEKLNLIFQILQQTSGTKSDSTVSDKSVSDSTINLVMEQGNNMILKKRPCLKGLKPRNLDVRKIDSDQCMQEMDHATDILKIVNENDVPISNRQPNGNSDQLKRVSKMNDEIQDILKAQQQATCDCIDEYLKIDDYGKLTISEAIIQDILLSFRNIQKSSVNQIENSTLADIKLKTTKQMQEFSEINNSCFIGYSEDLQSTSSTEKPKTVSEIHRVEDFRPRDIEDDSRNEYQLPEDQLRFHSVDDTTTKEQSTNNSLSREDTTASGILEYTVENDHEFDESLTKHDTTLEAQPENDCLSYSSKKNEVSECRQFTSTGLTRGILLDPTKLKGGIQQNSENSTSPHSLNTKPPILRPNVEKVSSAISDTVKIEFQHPQINYSLPKRTSGLINYIFDHDEPDFIFNQEIENRFDKSSVSNDTRHASNCSGCSFEVTDNSNNSDAFEKTELVDKEDNQTAISNPSPEDIQQNFSFSESSSRIACCALAELPNIEKKSVGQSESSSNSSESVSSRESKHFILNPSNTDIELKDMSRIKVRRKGTAKNKMALGTIQTISGREVEDLGTNSNPVKREKRQTDLSVLSVSSLINLSKPNDPVSHRPKSILRNAIRNSLKFLTNRKNQRKERETED